MPLALPRFCAILDHSLRPRLPWEEIGRLLAEAGVRLVQLRAKQATSRVLLAETRRLLAVLPASTRVIVNDRADVAALAGATGVHLGQGDLPVAAARALLGPEKTIGFSTHSEEQVTAAAAFPADYLAVGPIFPSSTKADAQPAIGLERLEKIRKLTGRPLVAIGGITPENTGAVLEAGADSVAVISGWLAARDISGRLEEFRRALGRLD